MHKNHLINKLFRQILAHFFHAKSTRRKINNWINSGRPIPPPHIIKQKVVADYQRELRYKLFIETGTYLGEMVNAQLKNFDKIISIELGRDLFESASLRFKRYSKVKIINGDSGVILGSLIRELNEPAIFWLDGHYSEGITAKGEKDCPIYEELEAILTSKQQHLLLIDDARMFNGQGDYPTIKNLNNFIIFRKPLSKIEISDDIIRVILKG